MPSYPAAIPVLNNPTGSTTTDNPSFLHSVQHGNANDEIEALATELGVAASGTAPNVVTRLNTMTGFRNAIRNGDMGVAQRGTGPFTASAYTLDGYFTARSGLAAPTINRVAVTPGEIDATWWLQFATASSSAVGDATYIEIPIESVRTFAGKQVTLSFKAKASAGTPKIGVEIAQNFGTGGAPSAQVLLAIQAVTVSTTAAGYSVTFTVPSITGKTVGTAGDDNLELWLWLSAGTTWTTRSSNIGHQNVTISITDVQLELGPVATSFERLPQQMQLQWCYRYLYRLSDSQPNVYLLGPGSVSGVGVANYLVQFPVQMRSTPSFSSVAGNAYNVEPGGGLTSGGGTFGAQGLHSQRASFSYSCGGGSMTFGRSAYIAVAGGGSGAMLTSLDFSAEL